MNQTLAKNNSCTTNPCITNPNITNPCIFNLCTKRSLIVCTHERLCYNNNISNGVDVYICPYFKLVTSIIESFITLVLYDDL